MNPGYFIYAKESCLNNLRLLKIVMRNDEIYMLPPPILVQRGGVHFGSDFVISCCCHGWCGLPLHYQMAGQ